MAPYSDSSEAGGEQDANRTPRRSPPLSESRVGAGLSAARRDRSTVGGGGAGVSGPGASGGPHHGAAGCDVGGLEAACDGGISTLWLGSIGWANR
jgi:hypothetical protein